MHDKIKLALIYGSTRHGRFCDKVAAWATEQIARHADFSLSIIDPVEAQNEGLAMGSFSSRIAAADAFLVVTPEYNHGYPAPLKSLIDSVGVEWHAKPIAFVSYGGISGGIRAVEQLRLVFAELHAATMQHSVSFASAWEQFDKDGKLIHPERAERSMATLLRQLHWWSVALRNARHKAPYNNAA
jgi:NAD(P)H-dependent FMN reductase